MRDEKEEEEKAPISLEDHSRLLVENVRDYAIFLLSPEGRVKSWNPGAVALKGYSAAEIIGQPVSRFYTEGDAAAGLPARLLRQAAEQGRVEIEGWRVRKDGSRFWADVIITAVRDEQGRLQGFAKITRDLTERREAEERLRSSEERFRLLVEGVSEYAIFMLNPDGTVAIWNAGAERIKGYSADEIVGRHFSAFYPEADVLAGKPERELETATRCGVFEEEGWRVRKDGTQFWASVVLTALRNAEGALIGFAKVTRDLTERRRLEADRMQLLQAEEAIRLRDQFLSIASHELRTPLTAIQLQLEDLHARMGDSDPRMKQRIGRALRGGERLGALIDALLDVSRISTGRMEFVPVSIDLGETMREVAEGFRAAATNAGCELKLEIEEGITGSWDRIRIEQVLMNLLSNAMKFGAGAPIRISLNQREGMAVIRVADQGPGVPPADRERIFGRFERASSTRHHGGLGLGLYVTWEIVAGHGGTVDVENLPDGGACFTVCLPLSRAAEALETEAG